MPLDFPSSPSIGQQYPSTPIAGVPVYIWDGEKWTRPVVTDVVRYDAAQSLTDPQKLQARQNIYAAPFDAMACNGMQINGGMEVSQENGTTIIDTSVKVALVDGWKVISVGAQKIWAQQGVFGPAGIANAISTWPNVVNASPAAGDFTFINQLIEGYRVSRLAFGTASASSLTISFWVRATRTGLFSGSLRNSAANRTYAFSYTINAVTTWEYKIVTIPGDTTGTWVNTNGNGLDLSFAMLLGTTYATTPGSWVAGSYLGATGQVNCCVSTSDYFQITGLTILPGTQAPTAAQSPFIMRPYDQELVTCQRYWRKTNSGVGIADSTTSARFELPHPNMRATPTITLSGVMVITDVYTNNFTQSTGNSSIWSNDADSGQYVLGSFTGLTAGRVYFLSISQAIKFDARL